MSDSHLKKADRGDEKPKTPAITRRKFLSYAGVLGASPFIGQLQKVQKKIVSQAKIDIQPAGLIFNVLRPDDLLCLDFEFINFKVLNLPRPHLVKENRQQPAYMIVHFPPQSVAEKVFYETTPELKDTGQPELPQPPPIFSRISGRARLSFIIPDEINEIPLTLESLLAWQLYQPSLVPVALPPDASSQITRRVATSGKGSSNSAARSVLVASGPARQNLHSQRDQLARVQYSQLNRLLLKPAAPQKNQTAIEMPYRLILSPNVYNIWVHAVKPVSINGWTELWQTRLAALNPDGSISESDNPYLALRAVWSPDVDLNNLTGPLSSEEVRLPLTANDRHQIVHLSSNFTLKKPDQSPYEPQPIQVNRMMLSSLGAWLDSIGNWSPVSPLSVVTWQHLATMGRDHYVRVVYKGYLLPFGHRASLVKVTERKFYKASDGQNFAYLLQKMYIAVSQPEKTFPAPFQPNEGREIPFRLVKITSLQTPPLDRPEDSQVLSNSGQKAFWPKVGKKDFQFQVTATDVEGHEIEFQLPMMFIDNQYAFDVTSLKSLVGIYNSEDEGAVKRRKPDLRGQSLSLAAERMEKDTTFEAESMTFELREAVQAGSKQAFELADQPMCFPAMDRAVIAIPALKNLLGLGRTTVRFAETYIQNGFNPSANKGEIFIQILENPPLLDFTAGGRAEKSGGLATPNFYLVGLSRILGPVGGQIGSASAEPQPDWSSGPRADADQKVLDEKDIKEALKEAVEGKFYPEKFFDSKAKILGGILLKDVVDKVEDFASPVKDALDKGQQLAGDLSPALKIKTEPVFEGSGQLPVGVKTFLKWTPGLHDFSIFIASRDRSKSRLTLNVEAVSYFNGKEATYQVKGELTDFTLDLIKDIKTFVRVKFSRFTFTAQNGQKPDVNPEIASLEFSGPFKFIEGLLKAIPLPGNFGSRSGFGGKPVVKVEPEGIRLGYSLSVPDVGFGVFSLQNLKFGGEISLPFTGEPVSLKFAFNEKSNRFLVTVAMFGGGGFFSLVLEPNGIKLVEGSLEFGGSFAMNLGVASGGMALMAGIYFRYEENAVNISGYVRCTGELDVLGLISISAEFYLELNYEELKNKVWGQASLTVKIKLLFFSTKVTLHVEREFGASPPPLFSDLMEENDWLAYCQAFA